MAIYRNREVEILGKTDGSDDAPFYTIMHKDMNRENVRLDRLQLTSEEYENLKKAHGEAGMANVQQIEDKDLQDLRDGQDREKIEERQGKERRNEPVAVSKVMVDPTEVSEKAPASQTNTDPLMNSTTRTTTPTPQTRTATTKKAK